MTSSRRKSPPRPADADTAPDGQAARDARLEAKELDWLDRMGNVGMRLIDRLDRRSGGQMDEDELEAFSRVGDDCNAFVKVSRSVRQIIVLEQEVAGLREPMVPRGPYGPRAANGNRASSGRENLRTAATRGDPSDFYDYGGYDSYEDYKKNVEEPLFERIERVNQAILRDLAGTEYEAGARRQSIVMRIQKYAAIAPHPALDACLAEMTPQERGQIYTLGLGQGPPPDLNDPYQRGKAPP